MKQYTNKTQTAKLIKLGFMPEARIIGVRTVHSKVEIDHDCNFAIGELIETLPMTITHEIWFGEDKGKEGVWGLQINTGGTEYVWEISYERAYSAHLYCEARSELIDALYDMIVKLKEEEVI